MKCKMWQHIKNLCRWLVQIEVFPRSYRASNRGGKPVRPGHHMPTPRINPGFLQRTRQEILGKLHASNRSLFDNYSHLPSTMRSIFHLNNDMQIEFNDIFTSSFSEMYLLSFGSIAFYCVIKQWCYLTNLSYWL